MKVIIEGYEPVAQRLDFIPLGSVFKKCYEGHFYIKILGDALGHHICYNLNLEHVEEIKGSTQVLHGFKILDIRLQETS